MTIGIIKGIAKGLIAVAPKVAHAAGKVTIRAGTIVVRAVSKSGGAIIRTISKAAK